MSQLLHGKVDIVFRDLVRVVRVKLIENGKQSLVSEEILDVNRGGQELRVINLSVIVVVHLVNESLNLRIRHL